mmetsp:Transcript_14417/g.61840  ORF Transcript_14417/g.61840 Transcript_14417/m.61840 type:complete len:313 (+) Transcript_14417:535-1473(+)
MIKHRLLSYSLNLARANSASTPNASPAISADDDADPLPNAPRPGTRNEPRSVEVFAFIGLCGVRLLAVPARLSSLVFRNCPPANGRAVDPAAFSFSFAAVLETTAAAAEDSSAFETEVSNAPRFFRFARMSEGGATPPTIFPDEDEDEDDRFAPLSASPKVLSKSEPTTTATLDAKTRRSDSRRELDRGRSGRAFSLASAAAAAAAARFAARSDLLAREKRLFSFEESFFESASLSFSAPRSHGSALSSRLDSPLCLSLGACGATHAAKSSVFCSARSETPNARSGCVYSPVAAASKTRDVTASASASFLKP